MAILSGIPVLNCLSIEDTLAFYQQLLQFVVVKKRDLNGELYWVHIMHGDTTLMLQSVELQNSEPLQSQKSNIALYFFADDIKELHHLIKAKKYNVSVIKKTDYQMQEFSLLDPEGNTIIVGQKF
jgi:catechol-2,3-dioxygenase